ncbi:cytosine-specific methyltransferase [Streptomyces albospinus]|uniref:Cytosine-specific methyltransferase n=1 Tax=Streptomyces albospinus TaxID=285515 RepID=A0ABQ2UK06_9ACTN|nr:DNA cytosine methyltransferase [Streptomyces albospinus]GGU41066.1 cytosine-specific methyltransferase [Streptomyces albospinus]
MTVVEQVPLFTVGQDLRSGLGDPATMPGAGLSVMDLFAGAGGLSEGFRQAGAHVLAGSDVDPDACATYRVNFPQAMCINGDIRQDEVREQVLNAGENLDILVGGPPCQAFSQVRNHSRLIDDPRNSLYREFVAMIGKMRPRAFVMENVPGMAQMGVLEQVVTDLALEGEYSVLPQVLDAADFGVPQTRKRIIFIGIHRQLSISPPRLIGTGAVNALNLIRTTEGYSVQARGENAATLLQRLMDAHDLSVVSAAQAISDLRGMKAGRRGEEVSFSKLPEAESAYQKLMRGESAGMLKNVSLPRVNEDTALRLREIPPGGNHKDLPERFLERYISGKKWGPSNGSGKLGRRHYYAYRRLHPEMWAWTLNTKADSVYHYDAPRSLSVREFARMQSFPDHFVFTTDERKGSLPGRIDGGAAHSRYRQVGNAVPPLLAAAIARAVCAAVKPASTGVSRNV